MPKRPRILLYSHDTFGLGHLRRSLAVAQQIAQELPKAHQLLLTGSMVAGAFGLPPRLDMVKLPALSKRSTGQYKSRTLPMTLKQTLAWREQMILQAAINFRPHLVLVDKVAAGVHGELLPALRHLKIWSPETKVVLGMRDIEDSPVVTRKEWEMNGIRPLLDDVYDQILLYGPRELFDPITAYQMSRQSAAKVVECGYLRRAGQTRQPEYVRRELGIGSKPLVLVTVGGGGDGYTIISTYLEMLASQNTPPPYHSLIVTGPLMPQAKRNILERTARTCPAALMAFTPDLPSYMRAADLVVSMAGYNTVCEILSLQKRAILIPRSRVRAEQRIRAGALAKRGWVEMLLPEELSAANLALAVTNALAAPPPAITLKLDGLTQIGQAVANLMQERPSASQTQTTRHQPLLAAAPSQVTAVY